MRASRSMQAPASPQIGIGWNGLALRPAAAVVRLKPGFPIQLIWPDASGVECVEDALGAAHRAAETDDERECTDPTKLRDGPPHQSDRIARLTVGPDQHAVAVTQRGDDRPRGSHVLALEQAVAR